MPLYEYSAAVRQALRGAAADGRRTHSGVVCPACGSDEVAKQFSTFASAVSTGGGGALPCGASSAAGCGSGGFS